MMRFSCSLAVRTTCASSPLEAAVTVGGTHLPEDEVLPDSILHLGIVPHVPVEDLAGKLLRVLYVDKDPLAGRGAFTAGLSRETYRQTEK